MTNKDFILNDFIYNSDDWDTATIKQIKKAMKLNKHQVFLNKKYTNYDLIDEFYSIVI